MGKGLSTVKVEQGKTLLLEGPASVRLETGEASILESPLSQDWIVVREDRQVPIETASQATVEVRLGTIGKYKFLPESTIPVGWREAAQILQQSPGSAIILGDVDSGKSTLCTFLANECVRNGLSVAVLDGDIGQADIGPPTTASVSQLRGSIVSLQDLLAEVSLFIGDTSPSLVEAKLIRSLIRLKGSQEVDVLLVNTDGWVRDSMAIRYKTQMLTELEPDFVFGISSDSELDPILELTGFTTLKLKRSPYARSRTREERKRAREFGYKRFLQRARRIEVRIEDVKLRWFDQQGQQLRLNSDYDLVGVLSGLLDSEERLLSIARIEGVGNGIIRLRTVMESSPKLIELGAVVLSPSFEEAGFES